MRDVVEIGLGKTAQRGYHLDDIAIVPSRRTRDVDDVSTTWQLDAYQFDIPCVAHPSDATMSPATAVALGQLGGLGVLNVEGLWTRYEDPSKVLQELAALDEDAAATQRLQEIYAEPIRPELIAERVRELRAGGGTVAVRVSPQHTLALAPVILDAGVDILVIQGTIVSAEHVSTTDEPLNLKEFIADLDLPVIVGGCTDYKTALHLMRTGAAGVIVGIGGDDWSTTESVLGIRVPMASAIADAAAARRDYLDETGGRYVHLIADGDLQHLRRHRQGAGLRGGRGDARRAALALRGGAGRRRLVAPGGEPPVAAARRLRRRPGVARLDGAAAATVRRDEPDGQLNLFGGLRRAMAKCGYRDLKEFQKVGLVLDR